MSLVTLALSEGMYFQLGVKLFYTCLLRQATLLAPILHYDHWDAGAPLGPHGMAGYLDFRGRMGSTFPSIRYPQSGLTKE